MRPRSGRQLTGIRSLALAASVALVLRATLGGDFSIAPMRIPQAWCLVCGPGWLMDGVSNVVLFLPLGVSLVWLGRTLPQAAGVAALLSLAVESLQAAGIPPLRSPSLADLLTNTTGGLLGAAAVRFAPILRAPSPSVAPRLLVGWLTMVVGTFAATALALQPVHRERSPSPFSVRLSPYAHAPGYGWYGGLPREVRVNGIPLPPRGEGPVVVVTDEAPDSLLVELSLRGRDTLPYQRAVVFLHTPADTVPYALLTQHGDGLRWEQRGTGYTWGLAKPHIHLPDVLAAKTRGEPSGLRIRASATGRTLHLAALGASDAAEREVTARLTPGIGWSLLQSVVSLSDPLAPVVRLFWYLVLLAPVGYWSRRLGLGWVVATAGITGSAMLLATQLGSVSTPDPAEWASLAAAFLLGLVAAGLNRPAAPSRYIPT